MMMQASAGPIPWWVLYAMVIALTWSAWRLARGHGFGRAIPVGCAAFVPLMIVGIVTLGARFWLLALALSLVPQIAALVGMRRGGSASTGYGALPQPRAMSRIPRQLLAGQPRADAVLRSRAMFARYAAGMPREAEFVARVRYVRGAGEMPSQPVDLFLGGGELWLAPLKGDLPPFPIPARSVLRVDVWPEEEGPPTLRVSWSPPAGELTAEAVLETMPNVPPQLILGQLQAIAGVLTTALEAEARAARAAEAAEMSPMTDPPPPSAAARYCSACGETVPPGARACPRCATPV